MKHLNKMGAALLAASFAFTPPALAHFQPKDGDSQKFKITLDDNQVGVYHVDYSVPQEGAILAKTTSIIKVAAMGKTLLDLRGVANELLWQSQFIEMAGKGQNGEETYDLQMKLQTDGSLRVTQDGKEHKTPVGTLPFSLWNMDTLKAKQIYDPLKQEVATIDPKKIRTENIRVLGERKECVKYKLKNPEGQSMYLWYGVDDEALCRVMIKVKKFKITYTPYAE